MALEPGTRLGAYEVQQPIGDAADGRYKATDTRDARIVAIRLLPDGAATSAEGRARLETDIRALSRLGHVHISTPVEIGHQEPTTDFVVSEFVEGETLADRLRRAPMDLSEALQTAIAIADSLDKAHRQGVVHGGLNPRTVVLTAEGPKLLDFAVARLTESPAPASSSSGMTSLATTRTSAVLVAAADAAVPYLAPEQLAGVPADARTDIFACGTLIYEMVTGRPAFQEKTGALLIAAIESVDPEPVSTLRPHVPAALTHLIQRCLCKDPRERVQTAWDLLTQLRWIADGGSQVGVPAPVAARRQITERLVWVGAAVAALVAMGLVPAALSPSSRVPEPRAARFTVVGLPQGAGVPITMSPDGRWMAGVPGAGSVMYGISLESVTPQPLVSAQGIIFQPFWSPDSRSVAFFDTSTGLLKRADISGGPAQTVSEAPAPIGYGTWSQNGVILFSSGGVIQRVLAAGGNPVPVTNVDEKGEPITGEEHLAPWFLPDGRHFLYLAVSAHSAIYLAELDTPGRTRLIDADSKAMYARSADGSSGFILFNRGSTIFAQPFDASTLMLTGEPLRVTDNVALLGSPSTPSLNNSANFAVSQTGALVFKHAPPGGATADGGSAILRRSLTWVGRNGDTSPDLASDAFAGVDLAPDGERFAVHLHQGDGGDIWTYDPKQRRMQRFTFDASQDNSSPIWSPDGMRIAFASRREGKWGLYIRAADGSGTEELVLESPERKTPMSWSPDGALLVYHQVGQAGDIWAVPVEGDRKPFAVLNSESDETQAQVSPDGRWITYQSNESGTDEVFVKQFPEGPAKRQVSTGGGVWPRWRSDGRELYFGLAPGIWAVDIDLSGSSPQPGVPHLLFGLGGDPSLPGHANPYHRLAPSSDGTRFLMQRIATGGTGGGVDDTLKQLADGGGGNAGLAQVSVAVTAVLNWPRLLQQR